jgi:4-amino-4-deoxy-L-arabinose transferase-like glycosyltransferase
VIDSHTRFAYPRLRRYAHLIAFGLVILLGAGLRMYDLSRVPTELVVDEIDLYNSAHSIATTGRDIDGTLLPFLYSPLTRNPPMYAIAGYASSLVFGKTPFGLRFPAVLFGLAAIVLIYGIAFELTRRRDIALVAALLQATQPIFIQFSRVAWEPASELPFLLAGLYVLLRTFRRADEFGTSPQAIPFKALALAAFLLGLTSYTYLAGWFYAVVLGGAVIALNAWRFRSYEGWMKILGTCAIWLLVSTPALWMWFFDPHTTSRTERIATFAQGISLETLRVFAANSLTHFRWSYLVTTGDPQTGLTWRYLNGFGAFFWWVIPLAVLGLGCAFRYIRARWALAWMWVWLFAYPLGGALTNEGAPNAPRTLAGAPAFCIFAALGFALLLDCAASLRWPRARNVAKITVRSLFAAATAVSVALFSWFYFTRYVHLNSNAWDSGTHAMFAAVRTHRDGYDRICFSVRPAWYGIDSYVRFYLDDIRMRKIENITDPACFLPGTLLVIDTDHAVARRGFATIATVTDVDGSKFAVITARPQRF